LKEQQCNIEAWVQKNALKEFKRALSVIEKEMYGRKTQAIIPLTISDEVTYEVSLARMVVDKFQKMNYRVYCRKLGLITEYCVTWRDPTKVPEGFIPVE